MRRCGGIKANNKVDTILQMDEQELNILKQMAMADGVLTENEKALFRELLDMTEEETEKFFEEIESELESVQSETEVIDWKKKNGLDFEKYVVGLLPDNYKNLRWTGDKRDVCDSNMGN